MSLHLMSPSAPFATVIVILHIVDDFIGHGSHQVTEEAASSATSVISETDSQTVGQ